MSRRRPCAAESACEGLAVARPGSHQVDQVEQLELLADPADLVKEEAQRQLALDKQAAALRVAKAALDRARARRWVR